MREAAEQNGYAALILEHLAKLAVREEASWILERALEHAGVRAPPAEAVGFGLFVCGPLRDAAEDALGARAADALVEGLSPTFSEPVFSEEVAMAVSGIRGTPKKRASEERVVLLASHDPRRGERLVARLRTEARVFLAPDLFRLMQLAEGHLHERLTVLIDGSVPGLRGPMLKTLGRLLPESARLIFWGVPTVSKLSLEVETLPREASLDEVLALIVGADDAPAEAARRRIVVADDDPIWRAALTRRLRYEGYDVIGCEDGFAALEACIDHQPDLVLTDLEMPALDGLQLAKLLRGRLGADAPPVVLVTGSELPGDDSVVTVLRKTGRFQVLLDLVAHLVADSAQSADGSPR